MQLQNIAVFLIYAMQFQNVLARHEIKHQLKDLVQQNRLKPCIIIFRKEGSGALPLALAFAQYIVCTVHAKVKELYPVLYLEMKNDLLLPTITEDIDSCGICPSCIKANN